MLAGFDIGGTKIELVVFDEAYQAVYQQREPTPTQDYEQFLETLVAMLQRAEEACGEISRVGVGMPGIVDIDTGAQLSSNIPAATGHCIAKDIEVRLARPTVLGNDCQCFALSEANGGAAAQYESVFGAVLGTGVGGGVCLNGLLIKGRNGTAGEWGHSPLPAQFVEKYGLPLVQCGCGKTGCVERYISGPGLVFLYQHCGGEARSAIQVIDEMRAENPQAEQAFTMYLDILACTLASFVHIYDPQAVVFGGGLSRVPELYQRLPDSLRQHLLPAIKTPALLAPKFGDSSGVRGAAMLAESCHSPLLRSSKAIDSRDHCTAT
ncbi:ROK family protein [Photobacterium atrarenae]|uniref:N-acetylglucosamine kinase n=1 Tax=Photobacterium atrarenae TaxID=865757 RepID=A0ABY5GLH8_9GAMM|nr:ROK family protein [Photobacterium atrarenae]UTV29636.1 ROK family protein [Photobacterium atrarenae]